MIKPMLGPYPSIDMSNNNIRQILTQLNDNFTTLVTDICSLANSSNIDKIVCTQNQTKVPLTRSYQRGKHQLIVFRNGVPQFVNEDYTEDSTESILFNDKLNEGDVVHVMELIYRSMPTNPSVSITDTQFVRDAEGSKNVTLVDADGNQMNVKTTSEQVTTSSGKSIEDLLLELRQFVTTSIDNFVDTNILATKIKLRNSNKYFSAVTVEEALEELYLTKGQGDGGGSTETYKIVKYETTQTFTSTVKEVTISSKEIPSFNSLIDILLVYKNGIYLKLASDYTIDGLVIKSTDEAGWVATTEDPSVFDIIVFRQQSTSGDSTINKLDRRESSTTITTTTNTVAIGIDDYDSSADMLLVHKNGRFIREGSEYTITPQGIVAVDSSDWEASSSNVTVFNFLVLKNIRYSGSGGVEDSELQKLTTSLAELTNIFESYVSNADLLIDSEFLGWNCSSDTLTNKQDYIDNKWFYVCYVGDKQVGSISKIDGTAGVTMTSFNTEQNYLQQVVDSKTSKLYRGKSVTFTARVKVEGATTGSVFVQILSTVGEDDIDYSVEPIIASKAVLATELTDYVDLSVTMEVPITTNALAVQVGSYKSVDEGVLNSDAILSIVRCKLEEGTISTRLVGKTYREYYEECSSYFEGRLTPPYSNPNLLINGDFQVWQRGTSFNEVNKYTADRWKATRNSGIPNVVKHDKGLSIFTDTQTARASIMQPLEDSLIQKLKGKTVVLSAKMFATTESTCGISIDVNTGTLDEYQINVGASGNILTKTFDIPSDVTSIAISVHNRSGVVNQNIIIEWVKLELGTVATPFVSRSYGEELALCQRYFEKSSDDIIVSGFKSSTGYEVEWTYTVEKRINPTIDYGNNGTEVPKRLYGFIPGSLGHLDMDFSVRADVKKCRFATNSFKSDDNNQAGTAISLTGWFSADAEIY